MTTRTHGITRGAAWLSIVLTLWSFEVSLSTAQLRPGTAVFGGTPPTAIDRAGVFTTLAALPKLAEITALTQAPDNDGLLAAITAFPAKPVLAVLNEKGLVLTLYRSWTLPTPWELLVDSRGRVIVVGTTVFGQTGFAELQPGGSFELKYEAYQESSNAQPLRAALDPFTDEVLVVTPVGEILRIGREDPIFVTTITRSAAFAYPGGIRAHPHADKLIVEGRKGDFYVVDRFSGAKTRIHAAPAGVESTCGWDVDPYLNALVVFREESGGNGVLLRVDLATGVSTVVRNASTGPEPRPMALAGTRILTFRQGRPAAGSTYELRVSFPDNPGGDYVVAASTRPTPGFALLGRHIPLLVDPLLMWSITDPKTFEGFVGRLDSGGLAFAKLHVPQATAGLRIYFAAISLKGSAIHGVSLPFGVTIE